jgi:hypothetical protein
MSLSNFNKNSFYRCQSRSHPEYSCISTTSDGNVAVGSNKGVIRLFSGIPGMPKSTGKGTNPKSAKTLLPGFGGNATVVLHLII